MARKEKLAALVCLVDDHGTRHAVCHIAQVEAELETVAEFRQGRIKLPPAGLAVDLRAVEGEVCLDARGCRSCFPVQGMQRSQATK